MAGEATVGSILGYLRLDRSDWDNELRAAGVKADELARHNPNIDIKTNAPSAIAQLSAVALATKRLQDAQGSESVAESKLTEAKRAGAVASQAMAEATYQEGISESKLEALKKKAASTAIQVKKAEEDVTKARRAQALATILLAEANDRMDAAVRKAEEDTKKTAASTDKTTKGLGALALAALTVGPALLPIAAVGAGALVGLAGAAGVALLGILGISQAIKAGTPLGQQYQAAFKPVVNEFARLKQISAAGMFAGINAGIKSVQPLFPQLNRDTAMFSSQIGQIAGHVGAGLVGLFHSLNPLFLTFGSQLTHGASSFQTWATSSQGVQHFVAYMQTTLPNVEQTLGSLITTVSHVAQGFAPWGGTMLTSIRLLSTALNLIPVGVLQTLVPLIASGALAFKAWSAADTASTKLAGLSTKLSDAGGVASKTSGMIGGLGKAVSFLGPAGLIAGAGLGVMSLVMGHSQQQAAKQTSQVNELVAAIQNGTARQGAWNNAQETGAAGATQVGLSQKQVTDAVMNTGNSYQAAQKQLDDYQRTHLLYTTAQGKTIEQSSKEAGANEKVIHTIQDLKDGLAQSHAAYQQAITQASDYASKQGDSALASSIASGAYIEAAKKLGVTGDAYINAQLAADKNTQSIQAATVAMQLENNAAGLLDQALQSLGGNNLGVAQATTQAMSAVAASTSALHTNGTTLDQNTDKGRANATALQQSASSSIALARAVEQQTGSTNKGNAALADSKTRLENALRSQGQLTPAIQAYIDTLFKIPARKSTTIDLADAAAKKRLDAYYAAINAIPHYWETQLILNTSNVANKLAAMKGAIGVGANAAGTQDWRGGLSVVGENGPEVVWMPQHAKVYPAGSAQTQAVISGTGTGGGGVQVTQHIYPSPGMDEAAVGAKSARYLARLVA
jgi:hypothetical protein